MVAAAVAELHIYRLTAWEPLGVISMPAALDRQRAQWKQRGCITCGGRCQLHCKGMFALVGTVRPTAAPARQLCARKPVSIAAHVR